MITATFIFFIRTVGWKDRKLGLKTIELGIVV